MEKLLGQLTSLSKQFEGAVKFKVGVGGGGSGAAAQGGMSPIVGRLIRGIPGGGMAMAFKSLGMIGGIATVALGLLGLVKKIFAGSRILGTISSSFFKAAGAMVDVMLMPILPLMLKALVWFIQKGFPLASSIGKWLSEIAEAIGKIFSGIKNIFGGILGGDFGQAWEGLKDVLGGFWDLAKKIVPLMLRLLAPGLFMLITKVVPALWSAVQAAFGLGKNLFGKLGGWIWDGLNTAFNTYKSILIGVGGWIADAMGSALKGLAGIWLDIGRAIGESIWGVLKAIPGLGRLIPSLPAPTGNVFPPKGNVGSLLATPRPASGGGGGGGLVESAIGGARNIIINAVLPGGITLPAEVTDTIADTVFDWFRDEIDEEVVGAISYRGP